MADRLSIDKKYANLSRNEIKKANLLQLGTNGEGIDTFMLALAIGVNEGYQTKSSSKEGLIQETAVKGKDLALSFIYSVALQELLKDGRENEITSTDIVYGIAEGYANTGFKVITELVPDFAKYDEETLVYELISKMDEKMETIEK